MRCLICWHVLTGWQPLSHVITRLIGLFSSLITISFINTGCEKVGTAEAGFKGLIWTRMRTSPQWVSLLILTFSRHLEHASLTAWDKNRHKHHPWGWSLRELLPLTLPAEGLVFGLLEMGVCMMSVQATQGEYFLFVSLYSQGGAYPQIKHGNRHIKNTAVFPCLKFPVTG